MKLLRPRYYGAAANTFISVSLYSMAYYLYGGYKLIRIHFSDGDNIITPFRAVFSERTNIVSKQCC